jgi:hypothetical protein
VWSIRPIRDVHDTAVEVRAPVADGAVWRGVYVHDVVLDMVGRDRAERFTPGGGDARQKARVSLE